MRRVKVLIAGICGFVGSTLARDLASTTPRPEIWGLVISSTPSIG